MPGHCIFEVKFPALSKGNAIDDLMRHAPFSRRTPIFIGDDVTDIAGFEAVRALGGHAYSVGREMAGVDDWFASPRAVRSWIEAIVSRAPAVP